MSERPKLEVGQTWRIPRGSSRQIVGISKRWITYSNRDGQRASEHPDSFVTWISVQGAEKADA